MLWFSLMLLPFVGSVAGYLVLRSRHTPAWFDALVVMAAATFPCIIWFWPQLVALDAQDLLEIQDMTGVLVPFWATVEGIPILFIGALLRFFLFTRTRSHGTPSVKPGDGANHVLRVAVAALCLCVSATTASAKTKAPVPKNSAGSSFDTAIVVPARNEMSGVKYEHDYIRTHYPRSRPLGQRLTTHRGKPYDIMMFVTPDGKDHAIYFDISRYFGRF